MASILAVIAWIRLLASYDAHVESARIERCHRETLEKTGNAQIAQSCPVSQLKPKKYYNDQTSRNKRSKEPTGIYEMMISIRIELLFLSLLIFLLAMIMNTIIKYCTSNPEGPYTLLLWN